jgi:hypothetical protein
VPFKWHAHALMVKTRQAITDGTLKSTLIEIAKMKIQVVDLIHPPHIILGQDPQRLVIESFGLDR